MKSANINSPCFFTLRFSSISFNLLFFIFSEAQADLNPHLSKRYEIRGFVKDMQNTFFTDHANSLITGNLIHNRINFKWNLTNNFYLRIESRNRFFYGEQVKYNSDFSASIDTDNGYFDFTNNILSEESYVFNSTFDRVLLSWSKRKWDVTVGRQRINWGVNLVWNPNDIFNTFNYFDFDYEERPGGDAIRLQYRIKTYSSIEFAYKLDKNKPVGAALYKTHLYNYDWQNLAGLYQEDIVLGTGWAGNIKQTSFKGEVSYFHSYKAIDKSGVLSASLSFDRCIKGNYFMVLTYLYNSEGKDVVYNLADVSKINLSVKNLMPFQHTLFFQASKEFNPLVNGSFSAMFSPTKKSLILFPIINISMSENWDLSFIVQSFFTENLNSYRTLGNTVFTRIRWSY